MALAAADTGFEEKLRAALPGGCFPQDTARYWEEPRGRVHGVEGLVVAPGTVEEVSAAMRLAHEARVGVIPYGGGTGLVMGQVLPEGPRPMLLSLHRLAQIRDLCPDDNTVTVEAGAILDDVKSAAQDAGRIFPLALASSGSAQIGGLFATNAGGANVLRYGMARDLALGVEAVLADGRIVHGLKRLHKDNFGLDLRHLLIGTEGTLGVITAVTAKLWPAPQSTATALLVTPTPETALKLLALTEARLFGQIDAFELIAGQGMAFLTETGMGGSQPFQPVPPWQVLIEISLAAEDAEEEMMALFEAAMEDDLVSDGVIAQSETQRAALWQLREEIPLANRQIGSISSHDISLPRAEIPRFLAETPAHIEKLGPLRINAFGHLGDGNLHYNVFPPEGEKPAAYVDVRAEVKRVVHDLTHDAGGSVAAEHGVGRLKIEDLRRYGDPTTLEAARAIKAALDPHGILNPGALIA